MQVPEESLSGFITGKKATQALEFVFLIHSYHHTHTWHRSPHNGFENGYLGSRLLVGDDVYPPFLQRGFARCADNLTSWELRRLDLTSSGGINGQKLGELRNAGCPFVVQGQACHVRCFPLGIKLRPRGTPSAFLSACTCSAISQTLSALKSAPSCSVLGFVVSYCSLARCSQKRFSVAACRFPPVMPHPTNTKTVIHDYFECKNSMGIKLRMLFSNRNLRGFETADAQSWCISPRGLS